MSAVRSNSGVSHVGQCTMSDNRFFVVVMQVVAVP
jgi:hypothetical protein